VQDREAQKVYKALASQQKKAIDAENRKVWGHIKRRDWAKLLKQIAADQRMFEQTITEKRSGALSEAERRVYRPYSHQRQYLLANVTSRRVKQVLDKKGVKIHQLDRPIIPRREPVQGNMARRMFEKG